MQLSERQARLLKALVEEHHATRRPVGSRTLVDLGAVQAAASTVRYELGRLEELGMLEAPHTSAGRVPTDLGYRHYIDNLLDESTSASAREPLRDTERALVSEGVGARIDEALRLTTQALAEASELLAVVTSPNISGAAIQHIEVLQLQPTKLVVVIITTTGDVQRQVFSTQNPIDPGLIKWVRVYLDEQIVGLQSTHRLVRQRLQRDDLHPQEQMILQLISPIFAELNQEATSDVHIGGSPELLTQLGDDVQRVASLVAMLDERRRLLAALLPLIDDKSGGAFLHFERRVRVSIGAENLMPELHKLSVVGASYGVGGRTLGMVGLIGPRAMDYPAAMQLVRQASSELEAYTTELYEQ